jgi:deoxyribodipyrimidine photolyase-related protein
LFLSKAIKADKTMKTLYLVLGNQLFSQHPMLAKIKKEEDKVLMIESCSLCSQLPYHKIKLAFILTSMRQYAKDLSKKGLKVDYFDLEQNYDFEDVFKKYSEKYQKIAYTCIPDKAFSSYLETLCSKYFEKTQILSSPQFLGQSSDFFGYLQKKSYKRLLMNDFYIHQRKKLNILMDTKNNPLGGKWSFDEANRKKLPKQLIIPKQTLIYQSPFYQEVKKVVNHRFSNNIGHLEEHLWLPTSHEAALNCLHEFFKERLSNFGDYEDAMTQKDDFVFHSTISPLLNNGLLTPLEVLTELDDYLRNIFEFSIFESAEKDYTQLFLDKIKLNSIEGFVRQIIGWREWIKGMYDTQYQKPIQDYNFFAAKNSLPSYFWNPKELECPKWEANLPLKAVLQKVFKYGYCHHIERLMILSNWCLLNEYDPNEVLRWFMSLFVDAYDWVMVPNVLGMGLFADGGIYATKPYISGGNYISKMSDYKKGDWERLWTGKFWTFLEKHKDYFSRQPRLAMLMKQKLKKTKEKTE